MSNILNISLNFCLESVWRSTYEKSLALLGATRFEEAVANKQIVNVKGKDGKKPANNQCIKALTIQKTC